MDRVSTRAIANIATTAQADRPIQHVFFALLIGINSIEVFELPADSSSMARTEPQDKS